MFRSLSYVRRTIRKSLAPFAIALLAALALSDIAEAREPENAPVRLGIVAYVRPSPFEAVVGPTIDALRAHFGARLEVRFYPTADLARAVRAGELDVFLSSSGFFLSMRSAGARSLATVASVDYPNPNHNDGAALVVRSDRSDLATLDDLKGRILATNLPESFTGKLVLAGEILRSGYDPDRFFGAVRYLGPGDRLQNALGLLASGEVDAVNLRLCFLEAWLAKHPEDAGRFRVVHRKDDLGAASSGNDETRTRPEPCRRSTDLYPAWTVASTSVTDPDVSRLVTRILLDIAPSGEHGLYWSVATDFSSIDRLFRDLKIGHYAYLRERTLKRFVSEYREWLLVAGLLALGLVLHSVRITQLVRRRTAELVRALDEQKRLELAQREAAERLERLERTGVVGQLSTIFAHEMRQPLGAISLYSCGLRKMTANPNFSPEQVRAVLDKLDRQTRRADAIVERVRAYAKRGSRSRTVFSLESVVRRAVADLAASGRFRARIVTEVRSGDSSISVAADPLEIEIVALNLIKNALEALEQQPSIADPFVTVTIGASEDRAELVVRDNGAALDAETLEHIRAFPSSTKTDGLGLGLSIVRGIVENHGGRLAFERAPEGGLLVRATIPLARRTTRDSSSSSGSSFDASADTLTTV